MKQKKLLVIQTKADYSQQHKENKYMEVVAEVKTLSVYMKCDKCNNCGYEDNYFVRYPYQKLVPLENLREMTDEEKK